jgi:hypothetical protein
VLTIRNPDVVWWKYTVGFTTIYDWRINGTDGELASQSDIDSVLADLASLRIRGEYRNGADIGGLDEVRMIDGAPGVVRVFETFGRAGTYLESFAGGANRAAQGRRRQRLYRWRCRQGHCDCRSEQRHDLWGWRGPGLVR